MRSWVAANREAKGKLGFNVHDEVFLLVAKPKISIVIVDGGATVAGVRSAVGVENFTHHEVSVDTLWVWENVHGLEKAVGIATVGLLGRGTIKHPDRAFFNRTTKI